MKESFSTFAINDYIKTKEGLDGGSSNARNFALRTRNEFLEKFPGESTKNIDQSLKSFVNSQANPSEKIFDPEWISLTPFRGDASSEEDIISWQDSQIKRVRDDDFGFLYGDQSESVIRGIADNQIRAIDKDVDGVYTLLEKIKDSSSPIKNRFTEGFATRFGSLDKKGRVNSAIRRWMKTNPDGDTDWFGELQSGLGSASADASVVVGGTLAGSLAGAPGTGLALGFAFNAATRYTDSYRVALATTGDKELAHNNGVNNMPVAFIDTVGDAVLGGGLAKVGLKFVSRATKEAIEGATDIETRRALIRKAFKEGNITRIADPAVKGFVSEGLVEGAGTLASGRITADTLNDESFMDQAIKDTPKAILMGGAIGGVIGSVTGGLDVGSEYLSLLNEDGILKEAEKRGLSIQDITKDQDTLMTLEEIKSIPENQDPKSVLTVPTTESAKELYDKVLDKHVDDSSASTMTALEAVKTKSRIDALGETALNENTTQNRSDLDDSASRVEEVNTGEDRNKTTQGVGTDGVGIQARIPETQGNLDGDQAEQGSDVEVKPLEDGDNIQQGDEQVNPTLGEALDGSLATTTQEVESFASQEEVSIQGIEDGVGVSGEITQPVEASVLPEYELKDRVVSHIGELKASEIEYISDESGSWDGRFLDGKIQINPLKIRPENVERVIDEELTHSVQNDVELVPIIDEVISLLTDVERKSIETTIKELYTREGDTDLVRRQELEAKAVREVRDRHRDSPVWRKILNFIDKKLGVTDSARAQVLADKIISQALARINGVSTERKALSDSRVEASIARESRVPKKKESKFVGTIKGNEVVRDVQSGLSEEIPLYDEGSFQDWTDQAQGEINSLGVDAVYDKLIVDASDLSSNFDRVQVTKASQTLKALEKKRKQTGDPEYGRKQENLVQLVALRATDIGQSMVAFRLFHELTPAGQFRSMQVVAKARVGKLKPSRRDGKLDSELLSTINKVVSKRAEESSFKKYEEELSRKEAKFMKSLRLLHDKYREALNLATLKPDISGSQSRVEKTPTQIIEESSIKMREAEKNGDFDLFMKELNKSLAVEVSSVVGGVRAKKIKDKVESEAKKTDAERLADYTQRRVSPREKTGASSFQKKLARVKKSEGDYQKGRITKEEFVESYLAEGGTIEDANSLIGVNQEGADRYAEYLERLSNERSDKREDRKELSKTISKFRNNEIGRVEFRSSVVKIKTLTKKEKDNALSIIDSKNEKSKQSSDKASELDLIEKIKDDLEEGNIEVEDYNFYIENLKTVTDKQRKELLNLPEILKEKALNEFYREDSKLNKEAVSIRKKIDKEEYRTKRSLDLEKLKSLKKSLADGDIDADSYYEGMWSLEALTESEQKGAQKFQESQDKRANKASEKIEKDQRDSVRKEIMDLLNKKGNKSLKHAQLRSKVIDQILEGSDPEKAIRDYYREVNVSENTQAGIIKALELSEESTPLEKNIITDRIIGLLIDEERGNESPIARRFKLLANLAPQVFASNILSFGSFTIALSSTISSKALGDIGAFINNISELSKGKVSNLEGSKIRRRESKFFSKENLDSFSSTYKSLLNDLPVDGEDTMFGNANDLSREFNKAISNIKDGKGKLGDYVRVVYAFSHVNYKALTLIDSLTRNRVIQGEVLGQVYEVAHDRAVTRILDENPGMSNSEVNKLASEEAREVYEVERVKYTKNQLDEYRSKSELEFIEKNGRKPKTSEEKALVNLKALEERDSSVDAEILDNARQLANETAMMGAPPGNWGELAKKFSSLVNFEIGGLAPFRFAFPFTNIIFNSARIISDTAGLGLFAGTGLSNLDNDHQVRMAKNRAFSGLATTLTLAMMDALTNDDDEWAVTVHGMGSEDKKVKSQMFARGWKPFTVEFRAKGKSTYVRYGELPIAMGLGFWGNVMDEPRYITEDKDFSERLFTMTAKQLSLIGELGALKPIQSALGNNAYGAESSLNSTVNQMKNIMGSSFIPMSGNVSYIKKVFDQDVYNSSDQKASLERVDVFDLLDTEVLIDQWGQPIKGNSGGKRLLERVLTIGKKQDAVDDLLFENRVFFSALKKRGGLSVNPKSPRKSESRLTELYLSKEGNTKEMTREQTTAWFTSHRQAVKKYLLENPTTLNALNGDVKAMSRYINSLISAFGNYEKVKLMGGMSGQKYYLERRIKNAEGKAKEVLR